MPASTSYRNYLQLYVKTNILLHLSIQRKYFCINFVCRYKIYDRLFEFFLGSAYTTHCENIGMPDFPMATAAWMHRVQNYKFGNKIYEILKWIHVLCINLIVSFYISYKFILCFENVSIVFQILEFGRQQCCQDQMTGILIVLLLVMLTVLAGLRTYLKILLTGLRKSKTVDQ